MTKKNKTPINIFTTSINLYFKNFGQFMKYMSFPVIGQAFGLIIIFSCVHLYSINLPALTEKYPSMNNFNNLIVSSIVITLPGLVILMKAFWEYLVAYGAVNSMLENMLKSGKVYDFNAHTELIKRRSFNFILLWLIIGIFSCIAFVPIFWIPAGVIAVYCALVFQVFTYEADLSPIGCIKKSISLIKGHFASTFMLLALSGSICYILIPKIFDYTFNSINANKFIAKLFLPIISDLPISNINLFLSQYKIPAIEPQQIALAIFGIVLSQILVEYSLPFRTILCGMWYRELNGEFGTGTSLEKKTKKSTRKIKSGTKKPSELLMDNSHKKFGTKKLDRNILKRAMEKDDD
ncbi:MAG: hypothetical protein MJ237_01620 [bacterium]|nr:hypothetical protein [bacterium]